MKRIPLSSQWSTFWAMTRKELIIMTRYPVEFVSAFIRIFLIIAVFTLAGKMFVAPSKSLTGSLGNVSGIVVYGFILFVFLSDTLWTIGYNVRNEQLQGTLEQLYLSPASKFSSLVSRTANTLLWTGLLCIASVVLMEAVTGRVPYYNPWLGLYLLVMDLAGTFGIGFAFAALTLRIKETAQTAANILQFGFLILCANFFPFSVLPPALLSISRLIPLSYGVDAFRSSLMGFPPGYPELAPIQVEIVIVTAFGVLMPFLGYYLYQWAEHVARHTGSLSEY